MGDLEKQEVEVGGGDEDEVGDRLPGGMAVLDFDMLCSTVALQTQGKWRKLESVEEDVEEGEFDGVFRMWEGELLGCFEDRRIAIESACCPCYRFGKNMKRAGFGSCLIQGTVHFILLVTALLNCIAFVVTTRLFFLYLALAFTVSVGLYLGFFRTQMRKKFHIRGGNRSLDDCIYHLFCPCCTLSQESRTLEMNNVQDGAWLGRSDTVCIGSHGESSIALVKLHPPHSVSTKFPEPFTMQTGADCGDHTETVFPSGK